MHFWPNPVSKSHAPDGKDGHLTQVSLTDRLRGHPTNLLGNAKTHGIILQEPPERQERAMLVLPEQSSGHHEGQSHTAGQRPPNDTEDREGR